MSESKMEELPGSIGWMGEAGFFEELRVKVFDKETQQESERVLRVPCRCRKPEGGKSWGREEDREGLEGLLRAHEEAVAGQRGRPDALELTRTFAPLLAAVRKMEGRQARTVDLSYENLGECLGMEEDGGRGLTRLPEDLRRIAGDVEVLKVESLQLRVLPAWMGELENLRSLAVGADFVEVTLYKNNFIREIPASIGELGALRELRL